MSGAELTPIPLMQIMTGFWASQTLAAAVELDLFTKLAGRGVDVEALTQLLELHPRPAQMRALISLNMLIETEGANYTWAEYTEWMEAVGFREIERVPIESPAANGLLIGRKP